MRFYAGRRDYFPSAGFSGGASTLHRAGSSPAPPLRAQALKKRGHLLHSFGMFGCQVVLFAGVVGKVVKLAAGIVTRLGVGVGEHLRTLARFDVLPVALTQ